MKYKFFIYQNKKYKFDFDLIKLQSQYFLQKQDDLIKVEEINLIDDTDSNSDILPASIDEFLHFFENKNVSLNLSNVFDLHFLSEKYEVQNLYQKTNEYISIHYKELINEFFSSSNHQNIKNSYEIENIISEHLIEILNNSEIEEKILSLPISIIHRIVYKYSNDNQKKSMKIQIENKDKDKLSVFLSKVINKNGYDTANLFYNLEIIKENQRYKMPIFESFLYHQENTGIYNEMFKCLYESLNELKEKNENLERKLESQKKELEKIKQQTINNNLLICSNIQSIRISNGIKKIPKNLFNEFNTISEIILPKSIQCIEKHAFSKCTKLTHITIPSSVKELGEGSFEGCSSLKEIKIPSTIPKIKEYSFNGCSKLTKIILYTSKNQYNIIIPKSDLKPKLTPNFSNIKNLNSLLSPIIFISPENKIISSVKKLKYQISPIFPSLISEPYSINIISFIDEKVEYKIENLSNPEYEKVLSIKDNKELIQLFINPPSATGNEPEILTLKGNLNIQAGLFEPYILPFELTLEILPLKIRLRCIEYQLAEENEAFRLCCDRVVSESEINFEVLNYFNYSHSVLAVEMESLKGNEVKRPNFNIDKIKKLITFSIPKVEKIKKCHFNIIIALSQNFKTVVHCDFVLAPSILDFEIYDFISKKFVSSECQIMIIPKSIITLAFKIACPPMCKQKGQIKFYLPQSMKLTSESIPINDKFEINGDLYFNLKLHINLDYNAYYGSFKSMRYNISIIIGNSKKIIYIKFVDSYSYYFDPDKPNPANNDFLMQFPCYSYNYDLKKWIMVKDDNELMQSKTDKKPYVLVTPFKFYSNLKRFNIIDYHYRFAYDSNNYNIMYHKLTLTKDINKLFIESQNGGMHSTSSPFNIFDPFNYYTIFGYDKNDKNIWFPAFCIYPDIKHIDLLEYDEKNIEIAKSNILSMAKSICQFTTKEIEKIFTQSNFISVDQKNFVIFMTLLTNKSIVLNIKTILSKMPNEVKQQFADILYEIKFLINNEINDNMLVIISHNLIFKFAQVFSAKYNEIESHQFCIQLPLTEQEIKNQQEKVLKEFLEIKTDQCQEMQSNSEFERLISQILMLPDKSQWKECFIINEKNTVAPCLVKDSLGKLNFNDCLNLESTFSDTIDSIESLPEIKLPKLISIQNINKFYSICFQVAFLLPTYLISAQIKKINQKDSELYFAILLDIYKEIIKEPTLDKSILSRYVKSFVKSFNTCVIRLKYAGVDFKNLNLPPSCNNKLYNNQDFIYSPKIETPTLKRALWYSNQFYL